MRNTHAVRKQIVVFATAAVCAAGLESAVFAQRGRSRDYPVGRRIEQMNRQADQYEREGRQRDIEEKAERVGDRKHAESTVAQVKEDFGRLQVIYNEIVVALSAGKTLDQAFVLESVSGINKCATRLKINLALPQSKDKIEEKQNQAEEIRLKTPLTILLNHISHFVTNPLFESSGVLDIELSTKASRDLDEIIHLSDSIRKSVKLK